MTDSFQSIRNGDRIRVTVADVDYLRHRDIPKKLPGLLLHRFAALFLIFTDTYLEM